MLFSKKQREERRAQQELLSRIDGKLIQYATRRDPDTGEELVLGKDGRICVGKADLTLMCDGREVFRCALDGIRLGELMSRDGVTIEGKNPATGFLHKAVAYYKYYR